MFELTGYESINRYVSSLALTKLSSKSAKGLKVKNVLALRKNDKPQRFYLVLISLGIEANVELDYYIN